MESMKANQNLSRWLVGTWWAGVKLLLRWTAVSVVLAIFWLPLMPLTYFIGEQAGGVLRVAFFVLCAPIVFYLTARYLHLVSEDDRDVNLCQESASPAAQRNEGGMRRKIAIGGVMAFFMGALLLSPSPDPFSALVIGVAGAILCWVPLLVLARFRFMKSASPSVQTLIVAVVCILAVLLLACLPFVNRISHMRRESVALTGLTRPTFMSALPSGLS
jgi:hypothetical protein